MGTNYYVYITSEDATKDAEELHIGKSSSGWVFSLRVYPDQGIRTLYDWLPVLLDSQNTIRDEYAHNITSAEMLRTISARSRDTLLEMSQADLDLNQAVISEHNLLRSQDHTR